MLMAAAAVAHPGRVESIADARRAPLGTTVTVVGTVTVPTGAFDGGFAVQQDDAGIYVADSLGKTFELGAKIKVTGVLVDSFGLLAIAPTAACAVGRGKPIEPAPRSTGSVGESTEGQLLKLRGTMRGPLVDDSPYGFKLDIDDGSGLIQIFLYPGTGIATDGLVDGAEIAVACFSNQFDVTYECDPRRPADLRVGHR
jgi:hypothetical protein